MIALLEFKTEKQCSTGYACGNSCINQNFECKNPLKGQAKTYTDWLQKVASQEQQSEIAPKKLKAAKSKASGSDISVSNPDLEIVTKKSEIKKLFKQWEPLIADFSQENDELFEVEAELGDILNDKEKISIALRGEKVEIGRQKAGDIRNIRKATPEQLNKEIEKLTAKEKNVNSKINKIKAKLGKKLEVLGIDSSQKSRVEASAQILEALGDELSDPGGKFIGVKDKDGNLQALMQHDIVDGEFYVDYLATAPWNILSSHPNKKKGAGSAAIESAIQMSEKKSKNGVVELTALPDAVPFYKKVGFNELPPPGQPVPSMRLSAKKSKEFLENQRSRNFAELSLDELEEKVGLIFTIPREMKQMVATLEFATKKKNCQKGYPCGGGCINKNRNCKKALKGQAKTFGEWLEKQSSRVNLGVEPTKAKKKQPKKRKKQAETSTKSNVLPGLDVNPIPRSKSLRKRLLNSLDAATRRAITTTVDQDSSTGLNEGERDETNPLKINAITGSGFKKGGKAEQVANELEAANLATVVRKKSGKVASFEFVKDIEKLIN